jgi:hypothetical protein
LSRFRASKTRCRSPAATASTIARAGFGRQTDSGVEWQGARGDFELRFFRNKEKAGVDFVVLRDARPWMLVECKSNDMTPSPTLVELAAQLATAESFQLVDRTGHDRELPQAKVRT